MSARGGIFLIIWTCFWYVKQVVLHGFYFQPMCMINVIRRCISFFKTW